MDAGLSFPQREEEIAVSHAKWLLRRMHNLALCKGKKLDKHLNTLPFGKN